MILHLSPGLTPVEVHVHNEYGLSETLTVAPQADAPVPALPAAPGPAASRTPRRMLFAVPVAAVVCGFIGYQAGSRADATGQEIVRAAALRRSPAMASLNAPALRWPDSDTLPQLAMPPMRSGPLQPESAADPAQAAVPVEVARALAQQPSVVPSRNMPVPAAAPQPAAQAGGNPFGLE